MMKKRIAVLSLLLGGWIVFSQSVSALNLIRESGWLECAYVTWQPVSGAESYRVCYSGEGITGCEIDMPLIRRYREYYRADVPGLKAGNYTLTVDALNAEGVVFDSATTSVLTVQPHIREGFAFAGGVTPGGYNADGTVKEGAKILYLTASSANTMVCHVINDNKKTEVTAVGLADILTAYGRGYDKTPLIIRMIGQVKASQIDGLKDGNYISFTGSNNTSRLIEQVTFEGIGDDATAYGYGFCLKRAHGVEIRNVGIMLFGDDGVSMDTDNSNIWIHHNDFFYGAPGRDADQVKGDGSIDMKYNSSNITISFNHFWESGKVMGCGGSKEKVPTLYMTFHHNWFDHTDSRTPRLHYTTAHIYNNYFDGVSKYCIGNTTESSAFVEANYFRHCDRPMMIAGQGTDTYDSASGQYTGKSTFSGQDGGMTKAFNNRMYDTASPVYQTENDTQFDAYLVTDRNETVPEEVKSVKGGFAYTNFDTAPGMYAYMPDEPDDVPSVVAGYAGRIDGGDFQWTFDNAVDDDSYDVNEALKSAIAGYETGLLYVQGEGKASSGLQSAASSCTVFYSGGMLCNPDRLPIEVYDAAGRLLHSGMESVNMDSWGHGIYLVRVVPVNEVVKLVKL